MNKLSLSGIKVEAWPTVESFRIRTLKLYDYITNYSGDGTVYPVRFDIFWYNREKFLLVDATGWNGFHEVDDIPMGLYSWNDFGEVVSRIDAWLFEVESDGVETQRVFEKYTNLLAPKQVINEWGGWAFEVRAPFGEFGYFGSRTWKRIKWYNAEVIVWEYIWNEVEVYPEFLYSDEEVCIPGWQYWHINSNVRMPIDQHYGDVNKVTEYGRITWSRDAQGDVDLYVTY